MVDLRSELEQFFKGYSRDELSEAYSRIRNYYAGEGVMNGKVRE